MIAAVSVVYRGRVTDRADVDVRLAAVELLLGHVGPSSLLIGRVSSWTLHQLGGETGGYFRVVAELPSSTRPTWVMLRSSVA